MSSLHLDLLPLDLPLLDLLRLNLLLSFGRLTIHPIPSAEAVPECPEVNDEAKESCTNAHEAYSMQYALNWTVG